MNFLAMATETPPVVTPDFMETISNLLNQATAAIVDMVTQFMPFSIKIALFGAAIFLVTSFIQRGARGIAG